MSESYYIQINKSPTNLEADREELQSESNVE